MTTATNDVTTETVLQVLETQQRKLAEEMRLRLREQRVLMQTERESTLAMVARTEARIEEIEKMPEGPRREEGLAVSRVHVAALQNRIAWIDDQVVQVEDIEKKFEAGAREMERKFAEAARGSGAGFGASARTYVAEMTGQKPIRYITTPLTEELAEVTAWMAEHRKHYEDPFDMAVECAHALQIFEDDAKAIDPHDRSDRDIPQFIVEAASAAFAKAE